MRVHNPFKSRFHLLFLCKRQLRAAWHSNAESLLQTTCVHLSILYLSHVL